MPYRDILTLLLQRLVRLLGAPAALDLARTIPKLAVDPDGTVLGYDREAVFGEIATRLAQQAMHAASGAAETSFLKDTVSGPAPPIRILVADDYVLVREGLVRLIEPQPDLQAASAIVMTRLSLFSTSQCCIMRLERLFRCLHHHANMHRALVVRSVGCLSWRFGALRCVLTFS